MLKTAVGAGHHGVLLKAIAGGASVPDWVPVADNIPARLFADFSTEGTDNHYWFSGREYSGYATWLAALGGTFSRAACSTGAWYVGSDKLLHSATTDELRFSYDPNTGRAIGILVEGATTNLALHSRDITQAEWAASNMTTARTATGADGQANTGTILTATANDATVLQTPGAAAGVYYFTVFLRRRTGSGTVHITYDGTNYSADLSASLNDTTYTRIAIGDQTTSVTPIVGVKLGTSGDEVDMDFAQLESSTPANGGSAGPASPIVTGAASVTRPIDNFFWTLPFTGWSTSAGSVVCDITSPNSPSLASVQSVRTISFTDTTANNRININPHLGNGSSILNVTAGGVSQASITATGFDSAPYGRNKLFGAWATDDFAACFNGDTVVTDNAGSIPTGLIEARIGRRNGTQFPVVTITTSLAYWNSRRSNSALQALTV